ncbi:MAG: aminopeptidase P family protein [Chitinophagaceae bacterium]|nr:aminopeptidase P family protein [Oligoflexus sp.]
MTVQERVKKLQTLLKTNKLEAYVVPSSDPHQSEYVAGKWGRREFISGFTGSSGLFATSTAAAGLWTDGRYFEQAEAELKNSSITLFRQGQEGVPDWQDWMIETLDKGSRVGINPSLFSTQSYQKIANAFKKAGLELVPQKDDLVDEIWAEARPELPAAHLYAHPKRYAGEDHTSKIKRLQTKLETAHAQSIVVSALDEIAWLFNLRGRDVPCNPVFYAYALVNRDKTILFTDTGKLDADLCKTLGTTVQLEPYESFYKALESLQGPVWLDPNTSSAAVEETLKSKGIAILSQESPIPLWKAVKNAAELAGMEAAHIRDGVAMVKFIRWLKSAIRTEALDEMSVASKLESFRAIAPEYRGPSFATISGYGPHGALPHYRAANESNSKLKAEGILLVDSGGQYDDGTTDITRTFTLGSPSQRHKLVYTTVLKGHLLLGRTHFPKGTNGYQLDTIARQPLWKESLEFNHGTGHGVGAALCVHEGPFSVSKRMNMTPLDAGNILSNEPGCYITGDFGVRIENLVKVVVKNESQAYGTFLGFEDLTLCPHDRDLIDVRLLSDEDRRQVDQYHARVLKVLSPLLEGDDLRYLTELTRPLA